MAKAKKPKGPGGGNGTPKPVKTGHIDVRSVELNQEVVFCSIPSFNIPFLVL